MAPEHPSTTSSRLGLAARMLRAIPLSMIFAYRVMLAPFLGGHCRFHPSCSRYAEEAVQRFGAVKGTWLAVKRVARCHPFGGKGFDPVPELPDESPAGRQNIG